MDSFSFKNLLPWSDSDQSTSISPPITTANSTEVMSVYRATDSATLPVLIIIVVIIIIVAAAVFTHIKLKTRRRTERQRRSQMMMLSTNSAGVYVDLSPPEEAFTVTKHPPRDSATQKLSNGEP